MPNRKIVKPTGWVVDMRHYLAEGTGDLPEVIPERVLSLAVFFGSIVAWVSDHLPQGESLTNVPCRRSPGRRRCRGEIVAELDHASGHILWHCPLCGDNGLIHGWEDTPWIVSTTRARRRPTPPGRRRTEPHVLTPGDVALTRRAQNYSPLAAVVLK